MQEQIVCPKCHSDQLSSNQKGFNNTAGAIGMLTGGALQGMALGVLSSGKILITCLKCANQFPPGGGAVLTTDDSGKRFIYYQELPKNRTGRNIAIILLIFLIIFVGAIMSWYDSMRP